MTTALRAEFGHLMESSVSVNGIENDIARFNPLFRTKSDGHQSGDSSYSVPKAERPIPEKIRIASGNPVYSQLSGFVS